MYVLHLDQIFELTYSCVYIYLPAGHMQSARTVGTKIASLFHIYMYVVCVCTRECNYSIARKFGEH